MRKEIISRHQQHASGEEDSVAINRIQVLAVNVAAVLFSNCT
jgi:hypothetical protein